MNEYTARPVKLCRPVATVRVVGDLRPTLHVYMRCNDVIYVIYITRRHVGGVLHINKDC